MNEGDARQASDAELLRELLEGRVREGDPRVDDLFDRRPQWRELSDFSRSGTEEERAAAGVAAASETDRRLVAECFAEARALRPRANAPNATDAAVTTKVPLTTDLRVTTGVRVHGAPVVKRWPRFLLAAAVLLLIGGSAWMWSQRDRTPNRKPGGLLGGAAPVDSLELGTAAPDYSSFEWKEKALGSGESFVLKIWAADVSGARGDRLYSSDRTSESKLDIPAAKRANWPETLIWRVDRVDSNGFPTFGTEWLARRSAR